ncbi:hypothetical protein GCM10027181_05250 [Rheinheimera gaetbuli]
MMTILRCCYAVSVLCLTLSLLSIAAVRAEEPVAATNASEPQLVWCLDHFSRFHHYEDTVEPYGPSVDLMRELAKRAGFSLRFSPRTTAARCLRLMAEGKVDLMSNLRFSDERNSTMFMLPYNKTVPESLFLRYDDRRNIDTEAQLQHLTLVSIRSYLYSPSVMAFLKQHPRQTVTVDSIEAGLEMLLRGRVDGLISPTVSTSDAINTTSSYRHRFRIATLNLSGGSNSYIHIALSRSSSNAVLEPVLRKHLDDMVADGTVARLYDKAIAQSTLLPPLPMQPR